MEEIASEKKNSRRITGKVMNNILREKKKIQTFSVATRKYKIEWIKKDKGGKT